MRYVQELNVSSDDFHNLILHIAGIASLGISTKN